MLTLELKDNRTKYHFHKISYVKYEEDGDLIEIRGNFDKGKKYKIIKLRIEMVKEHSYNDLMIFLKNKFKYYEYDGLCPNCNSSLINKKERLTRVTRLNEYKKKVIDYKDIEEINCFCLNCKTHFKYDNLKYSNTIIYFR